MKRIFNFLIIFFIFGIIFIFFNRLVSPKYVTDLVEGNLISSYYSSSFDHDVIYLGDCEMYANFSPMVDFKENGIKSYVRASSQQLIWQSYYVLKETLKYEKPKIVVFNVNSIRYDRKTSNKVNEAYNRLLLDKMKWSKEKIELIKVSMDENESFISYVFPILRYHSRITSLTKEDFKYLFKNEYNSFNGFLVNKNVIPYENLPAKKPLSNYEFSSENIDYLNKIVKLCKDENIKLILVKAPSLYPYWYNEYDSFFENYSKENNIDYINLLDYVDEIGIDYSTDTYDGGLHLNLNGATKLSKFFSTFLANNYNINNYRGEIYYEELLNKYLDYVELK